MYRFKLYILLLLVAVAGVDVFGQNNKVRYVYRITYEQSGADSSITIIEKQYLNRKGQEVKTLSFGPAAGDTCYTNTQYNKIGDVINEITVCNDKLNADTAANASRGNDTTGVVHRTCVYNVKGRLIYETLVRRLPYFEVLKTSYGDSCSETLQYDNEEGYAKNIHSFKNIECSDGAGNISRTIRLNYKGDTVTNQLYLYRNIGDTLKDESALPGNVIFIGYFNNTRQEVVRDYYSIGTRAARLTWVYAHNKCVAEELYSYNKMAVLSQTAWVYNNKGVLIKMVKKELDSGIENVLYYRGGQLIRKEYFIDGKLSHAIVYTAEEKKL